MKKFQLIVIVLTGLFLVNSCGNLSKSKDTKATKNATTAQVADSAKMQSNEIDSSTEKLVYRPSRTILTDLINTKLEITPIWEKSQLKGIETLTAKPHFYPSDSLILDAKGMDIYSVKIGNQSLQYNYKNDTLKIKLDKTYTREEKYTVVINYLSKPEEIKAGGSAAITSDKGLYFINPKNDPNDFMPQIWTQGETESNSVWFPTVDSPNMKSSAEFYITVDKKFKTLANGKFMSSKDNSDGTRTDYWKQENPMSMYLFMFAVGEFDVTHDFYTKQDGSKLAVDYYVEPEWNYQAKAIFGNTPEMIGFFSKLLGIEYPWDKFSQIIVREYVSGAMENVGAVVFGDFMYRDSSKLNDEKLSSDAVIAHELFHHWFGDLVTAESWSNLTLNESFANYSEFLWNEHKYGLDVAQMNLEKTVDGYYNAGAKKHDLVWFYYKDREDMFDATSYNKGGAILNQLRGYVGDDAFFKSLNLYLNQNKFSSAEAHNLRLAFEKVTGEDLNWYFNEWYYGKGEPDVDINLTYNYGKTNFTLNFDQKQQSDFPTFTIPMVISYSDNAGTHTEKFKITGRNQNFTFPISGSLKTVIIDPAKTLVGHYNFLHKNADFWLEQFEEAQNYSSKKEAIDNYFEIVKDNTKINNFSTLALKDSFYGTQNVVLSNLLNLVGQSDSVDLGQYVDVQKVKDLALNGTQFEVRSNALNLILSSNQSETDKLALLDQMSKNEKSYSVIAAILNGYLQLQPDKANEMIESYRTKYKSSEIEYEIAKYYIKNRVQGKMDYFQSLYKNSGIREKGKALLYLGYYSFSSGFKEMNNYIATVDSVYDNLGRYKTDISQLVETAYSQLSMSVKYVESSKDDKNSDKIAVLLPQLKETTKLYEDFLKKHNIAYAKEE